MKKPKTDTIKIGTYFDFDTEVKGNITTKSSVKVDGKIFGDLTSSQDIVIGEKCVVEGNVTGRDIIVDGYIKGNVFAEETVTLANKGKIEGDVRGTGFVVDIGSQYSGKCTIVEKGAENEKSSSAKKSVEEAPVVEANSSVEEIASVENKKTPKNKPSKIVIKELEEAVGE